MLQPLVEVLMSTFNGERFVVQQVESILNQTYSRLRLVIRDDGSTDRTLQALTSISDNRVVVRPSSNLGLPAAFFRLIEESSEDAEYWALADQDDVWEAAKLARAVAALEPYTNEAALYCARVLVTDEALHPLYPHEPASRGPSFANALVQNIALGCTVVFNRAARDEFLRASWPRECVMHDAWLYLVVAGTGRVLYDPALVVQYRQHGANSVGIGRGPLSRLAGRVKRQLSPGGAGRHGRQDLELARIYRGRLSNEARRQLDQFLASRQPWTRRLHYAITGPAHRQSGASDFVLKVLHVFGRV